MCPCVRLSVCVPKKFMYCIKSHMFVFSSPSPSS